MPVGTEMGTPLVVDVGVGGVGGGLVDSATFVCIPLAPSLIGRHLAGMGIDIGGPSFQGPVMAN